MKQNVKTILIMIAIIGAILYIGKGELFATVSTGCTMATCDNCVSSWSQCNLFSKAGTSCATIYMASDQSAYAGWTKFQSCVVGTTCALDGSQDHCDGNVLHYCIDGHSWGEETCPGGCSGNSCDAGGDESCSSDSECNVCSVLSYDGYDICYNSCCICAVPTGIGLGYDLYADGDCSVSGFECLDNYQKCVSNSRYNCVDNKWVNQGSCGTQICTELSTTSAMCVNPTNQYCLSNGVDCTICASGFATLDDCKKSKIYYCVENNQCVRKTGYVDAPCDNYFIDVNENTALNSCLNSIQGTCKDKCGSACSEPECNALKDGNNKQCYYYQKGWGAECSNLPPTNTLTKKPSITLAELKSSTSADKIMSTCSSSIECESNNCVSLQSLINQGSITTTEATSFLGGMKDTMDSMVGGAVIGSAGLTLTCALFGVGIGVATAASGGVAAAVSLPTFIAACGLPGAYFGAAIGYLSAQNKEDVDTQDKDKVGFCMESGATGECDTNSFAYKIGHTVIEDCGTAVMAGWGIIAVFGILALSMLMPKR